MASEKERSGASEPVLVRLPDGLLQALDTLRRTERDIPTRPEMIRRILQAWIDAHPPQT
jgi:metal-responsive CopG/Arc/MetJ family transcriptional regulator